MYLEILMEPVLLTSDFFLTHKILVRAGMILMFRDILIVLSTTERNHWLSDLCIFTPLLKKQLIKVSAVLLCSQMIICIYRKKATGGREENFFGTSASLVKTGQLIVSSTFPQFNISFGRGETETLKAGRTQLILGST